MGERVTRTAIDLRVLGGVDAYRDGDRLNLGPARRRTVLAVLLVDANRQVPVDELIDRVWGDHAPARVSSSLYSYLTRLRRTLDGGDVRISRGGNGYELSVDPHDVDLHRFRALIAKARRVDDPGEALAGYTAAAALWRGEPFAGLDTPWLASVRDTLCAEWHALLTDSTDLRLARGENTALIPDLTRQAELTPLDERLVGQLMLALYRGGRPAYALERYHRFRVALADELGVDPGDGLRTLYQRIVTGDPSLSSADGHYLNAVTR